jgi:hypothetical protein
MEKITGLEFVPPLSGDDGLTDGECSLGLADSDEPGFQEIE